MGRPVTLTEEQEKKIIYLYTTHHRVPDIMREVGIGSNQTVYRILRKHGIEPSVYRKGYARTIAISLDEETDAILRTINPSKPSAWICDLIKRSYPIIPADKKKEGEK